VEVIALDRMSVKPNSKTTVEENATSTLHIGLSPETVESILSECLKRFLDLLYDVWGQ
jgi:hypothetical protein